MIQYSTSDLLNQNLHCSREPRCTLKLGKHLATPTTHMHAHTHTFTHTHTHTAPTSSTPLHRWENWGLERERDYPKIKVYVSGRTKTRISLPLKKPFMSFVHIWLKKMYKRYNLKYIWVKLYDGVFAICFTILQKGSLKQKWPWILNFWSWVVGKWGFTIWFYLYVCLNISILKSKMRKSAVEQGVLVI